MSKICYVPRRFSDGNLAVIAKANRIIEEYAEQGLALTLRQLYYQFVSRDFISNQQSEYKKLGSVINDGRLAGLIDWNAIEDRTRAACIPPHWKDGADIIDSAAASFALDKWRGQEYRVEVWVEKEALAGVFEAACASLDVPTFACRGYVSQSEMWAAGQRMRKYQNGGAQPVVLHFGDHDPSGIDMTRDIRERLAMFVCGSSGQQARVLSSRRAPTIERIALNMEQIEEYQPPPNPAKETDSRFEDYRQRFGDESWELDALEPKVLRKLIQDNVARFRNDAKWDTLLSAEKAEKSALAMACDQWEDIKGRYADKIDRLIEEVPSVEYDEDDDSDD